MAVAGQNALTTFLGYNYSTAEALLSPQEKTELDALWESNYTVTRNTSKSVKRRRATAAAATVGAHLNATVAKPKVTYSDGFKTNHVSEADVSRNTAKQRGEARHPIPPHNTVLKESYIRDLLQTDAAGKGDGENVLNFQSPNSPGGKISLATRKANLTGMTADDTGLYFVRVNYTLTTTAGATRAKTIRAYHIETDDVEIEAAD
jgi:hypothetical protein